MSCESFWTIRLNDALTVIVLAAQSGILALQWRIMRKQDGTASAALQQSIRAADAAVSASEAAHKQVEATRDMLEVAQEDGRNQRELTLKTLNASTRPYLLVDSVVSHRDAGDHYTRFELRWKNYGATPAIVSTLSALFIDRATSAELTAHNLTWAQEIGQGNSYTIVPSGGLTEPTSFTDALAVTGRPLAAAVWGRQGGGPPIVYLRAFVRYRGIDGSDYLAQCQWAFDFGQGKFLPYGGSEFNGTS